MLAVWQALDRHPFYVRLDRAIARHLGTSGVRDIFALGDAGALRDRVAKAGFRQIEIEPFELLARFPDPDGFLAGEIDVDTAAIPAMPGSILDTAFCFICVTQKPPRPAATNWGDPATARPSATNGRAIG